jgi:thiamine pyrophosphate-dependent acetolactate synthase large subunit-like protein
VDAGGLASANKEDLVKTAEGIGVSVEKADTKEDLAKKLGAKR